MLVRDLARGSLWILKYVDLRVWFLTDLQCGCYIYGHMLTVIVGLSKLFLKHHNAETRLIMFS